MTRFIRSLPFLYTAPAVFITLSHLFRLSVAAQIVIWGMFVALQLYLFLVERVPPVLPALLAAAVYLSGLFTWGNRAPTVALLFVALPIISRWRPAHYPWYAALSLASLVVPAHAGDVADFTLITLFIVTAIGIYLLGRDDLLRHFREEHRGFTPQERPPETARFAIEDPYLPLLTYLGRLVRWQEMSLSLKVVEIRGEEGMLIGSGVSFRLTGLLLLAVKNRQPIPCTTLLDEKEHLPLMPEYDKRVYFPLYLFGTGDPSAPPEYVVVADTRFEGDKQILPDLLRPLTEDILLLLRMAVTFERILSERKRQERLFRGAREILDSFSRDRLFNASAWAVFNFVPDAAAVLVTERRDGEHRGFLYRPPAGDPGLFSLGDVSPAVSEEIRDPSSVSGLMLDGKMGKVAEIRDINKRRNDNLLFPDPAFAELNRYDRMATFLLQHQESPQGTLSVFLADDRDLEPQTKADLSLFCRILSSALNNIEMYETVQNLSNIDALTGLYNRRYLQERLEHMLNEAGRLGTPLAVIMLDIDHFKKVNDRYGHKAGDDIIRFIARVLKKSIRKVDVAARYGGEEFIVLLHNTTDEGAVTVADKIRETIQGAVVPADGNQLTVTSSFGVSAYPDPIRNADDLIKSADEALYRSKEQGRNRVTRYVASSS